MIIRAVLLFCCVFITGVLAAKDSPAKVQVYSRGPGDFEKANVLICHVSGFHPPEISIQLLRNNVEIPGAQQTDLAFQEDWYYHLTKHVSFTPQQGETYVCRVTHMGREDTYIWEPDM